MSELIEKVNPDTGEHYFVHESSYVDEGVQIGEGTKIWHFSHIMKNAKIGKKCSLGQNVNVGSKAIIGNNVKIQNNVSVYDDVIIEDDVFCGPSMVFTNVINPRAFIERKDEYKKTLVKKGASIGANATIVCGVEIGRYALIGSGAVVTKNVPDYALMVGVPARQIGWVCYCGVTLKKDEIGYICPKCGKKYILVDSTLTPED
ncbi:MAG: acyltransferase [Spirochaetota bacterium]